MQVAYVGMAEEFAPVNGIEVCYERFGEEGRPPLLLIMGLGGQMIWWDDEFCQALADRGFSVVRYDNRDVGRSTIFEDARVPKPLDLLRRNKKAAAYSLEDMADDGVGLLDHLGIDAAHIVGASMGGMIAQTITIRHPRRVLSLTSIMSTTGDPGVGKAKWRLYPALLKPSPTERDAYVKNFTKTFKAIGSPGFPFDAERSRELAGRSFDRSFHPAGSARQLAAIVTAQDRTPLLRELHVPALVIHGADDKLVAPSGGRATADAIPGARLVMVPGMGHDMPPEAWPRMLDAIEEVAARAGDATPA
jgi:pimeloyl-ACP methyl ester carboxylesterase